MHGMLGQSSSAPAAWLEPGTVSLLLYSATLLIRGRAGSRLLVRHLRRDKETLADVATDELSDFLCDHSYVLMTLVLVSSSLASCPSHRINILGAGTGCGLVARAPAPLLLRAIRRGSRTLVRAVGSAKCSACSSGTTNLHLLWRQNLKHRGLLQAAQAKPDEPGSVRHAALPGHTLRLPILLWRARRAAGAALHLVRELAEAVRVPRAKARG